jgi:hypothetical protein
MKYRPDRSLYHFYVGPRARCRSYFYQLPSMIVRVAESIRHTPNLLELELLDEIGFAVKRAFWVDFTYRVSSPCLVPKLRRIKDH